MEKDKLKIIVIINIIILSIYFLVRIINQSGMTYIFPIDAYANDYSSHIANLYFLDVYGYHNVVPNWYNGNYVLFAFYPPLWHYFTLPLYYLTQNVLTATFLSLILMYVFGFLLIYFFCRLNKVTRLNSILFFLFLFANPISIGVFLRLGKLPELFGWLFFILFSILIFYYRDKKLDVRFLIFFTLFFSLLMYAHTLVFIISLILVGSLFLIKSNIRERAYIAIGSFFTFILTYPVWYPILSIASKVSETSPSFIPLRWLVSSAQGTFTDKLTAFVIPIVFLALFYFYFVTNNKPRKFLVFFAIPLVVSVLYFTRILVFIPYFNRATPDMYNFFFIFLGSYMFFRINFDKLGYSLKKFVLYSFLIIPIIGIIISSFYTPWFMAHTKQVDDTFSLFPLINKNFVLLNPPKEVSAHGAYSYGPIYYNLSTPSGWSPINLTLEDRQKLNKPDLCAQSFDCNCLKDSLKDLEVKQVISYATDCVLLDSCKFKKIRSSEGVCLYEYDY